MPLLHSVNVAAFLALSSWTCLQDFSKICGPLRVKCDNPHSSRKRCVTATHKRRRRMHCSSNSRLPSLHERMEYQRENWKSPKQSSASARFETVSGVGEVLNLLKALQSFRNVGTCTSRHWKNTRISNFMKIRPVGADTCGRTDRQADRHDEVNSRFSQFCEHA
jgi:hypothetical protein